MSTLRSASACCALAAAIFVIFPLMCPAAEPDKFPRDTKGVYDLTCKDISARAVSLTFLTSCWDFARDGLRMIWKICLINSP